MMIGDDHHVTKGGQMVWRSLLSVPGSNLRMVEKAFASDVDAIDLEDAVAPIRVLDLERRAV
jgi:citrate lyase beta subunit